MPSVTPRSDSIAFRFNNRAAEAEITVQLRTVGTGSGNKFHLLASLGAVPINCGSGTSPSLALAQAQVESMPSSFAPCAAPDLAFAPSSDGERVPASSRCIFSVCRR